MSQLWDGALDVQMALIGKYVPANTRISQELGLEQPVWNVLLTSLSYEPEAVSTAQLRKRNPYSAPSLTDQRLRELSSRGFLESQSEQAFRLTEKGRAQALSILETLRGFHKTIQPLSAEEMSRAAQLLNRMVSAAEKAPMPPGTWCLTRARRLEPTDSVSPTTLLDYNLSCLNAFRDDCHLSAWQAHKVSGEAWELFTLIWQGQPRTLESLLQGLAFRAHEPGTYATALAELVSRGWLSENGGLYALTESGKALRDEVEATTDRYFSVAESGLTAAERSDLESVLAKLLESLRA